MGARGRAAAGGRAARVRRDGRPLRSARWRGPPPPAAHGSVARHREEGEEKKSLEECLAAMERPSQLDEANAVRCDSCGRQSQSFLQSKLEKTGSRLLVQLNRFPRRQLAEKLDIEVTYRTFFLSAVVCHVSARAGTAAGGHYFCYAKKPGGRWLKFNDSFVSVLPEEKVATKNAYLLLYTAADDL